jgi:hypothetical protein
MRGSPLGLSESHKGPEPACLLQFIKGGSLITVKGESSSLGAEKRLREGEGKRGRITQFSRKSRMHFRKLLASVRTDCLPLFLTLTYPKEYSFDWQRWKRDLKVFCKRMDREWPSSSLVWRLEFQKRGAPHFHIFLYGIYDKSGRQRFGSEWLSDAWFEIVGSGDEKHRRAGTKVEVIRTRAGAMSYAVGYNTKMDQTLPGQCVGRYWGVWGRERLPVGEKCEFVIPQEAYKRIKRTFRRFQVAMNRKSQVGRLAKRLRLGFGEVMDKRQARELKGEKLYTLRLRNNWTVNLFCDVGAMARYVDSEITRAETLLNKHFDEPF